MTATNRKGYTPLHEAAKYNKNLEIVQMLLGDETLLSKANSRGYTSLHSAAYWNTNPEIVQFLLEKGASVTAACKNGQTAVQMIGSRDRRADVIKRKKEIFENWIKLQPAVL